MVAKLRGRGVGVELAKGAGGSFVLMVVSAGIAFGTNVVLARVLGVTEYGMYIYALEWINLLAWACQLGLVTSLVRFVSAYNAQGEWGLFRGILSRSIQYVLLATLVIGIVAACVMWLLFERIGAQQTVTLWIALLILPLIALTGLRQGALRGLKRVVIASVPDSIVRPLLIAIMVVLWYSLAQQPLQAPAAMVINLVAALVAFGLGSMFLVKCLPERVRHAASLYAGWEWLKVSLPMFFGSGMFLILRQADVLMVGVIMGPAQAGIYAVVSRITELVSFGTHAIDSIAAPMISELHSTKKLRALQRMATFAARGTFAFSFVMSVLLALVGTYVLALFGEEFVVGYDAMQILLVGVVIKSLFGSAGFLLSMTGYHTQGAVIAGACAALNIALNATLIPTYGLTGAAVATAVSNVFWSIIVLIYVMHRVEINPTIFARIKAEATG